MLRNFRSMFPYHFIVVKLDFVSYRVSSLESHTGRRGVPPPPTALAAPPAATGGQHVNHHRPARPAQAHPEPHPDKAARQRRDRLAKASVQDMESALAFLSMIDPEAFEIAFTAVAPHTARSPRSPRHPRTRSPSRCAANAAPPSGSSLPTACGGSPSSATTPRPAPTNSATPAIAHRSAGSFPVRTRESSSQQASVVQALDVARLATRECRHSQDLSSDRLFSCRPPVSEGT